MRRRAGSTWNFKAACFRLTRRMSRCRVALKDLIVKLIHQTPAQGHVGNIHPGKSDFLGIVKPLTWHVTSWEVFLPLRHFIRAGIQISFSFFAFYIEFIQLLMCPKSLLLRCGITRNPPQFHFTNSIFSCSKGAVVASGRVSVKLFILTKGK